MALFGSSRARMGGGYPGVAPGDLEHAPLGVMPGDQPTLDMLPIPNAQKINHPFFSQEGGLGGIAGTIGDFLQQQAGGQATYAPQMQRRQQHDQELELWNRRLQAQAEQSRIERQQALEDWMMKQQFERDNPNPTAAQQNYKFYNGLTPEEQKAFRPMLGGYQYTPEGIAARVDSAGQIANAQGAARAAHRAPPSSGKARYVRNPQTGQMMKWVD